MFEQIPTQTRLQTNGNNPKRNQTPPETSVTSDLPLKPAAILQDYRLAYQSRQASLIGRREVLSGKAKFGIFGDGKEIAQVALAHFFQPGDWRSGYYRDQTLAFATGMMTIRQFFAQLYAHTDVTAEPATAGRSMNGHFGTRSLNEDGSWRDLTQIKNSSSDISPTGSQIPRLVGLGYASKLFRLLPELHSFTELSRQGNEVAFGTVGNATCAEGMFWEGVNAIGVLQVPVVLSIWDDGYGISVPSEYQVAKSNLYDLLLGFQRMPNSNEGLDVYTVKGWDYMGLLETYQQAVEKARREHVPALIHVAEVTQPQGHSTSGSHERYKSAERLAWEAEFDGLKRMRQWLIAEGIVTVDELEQLEKEDQEAVEAIRREAWEAYLAPIKQERQELVGLLEEMAKVEKSAGTLPTLAQELLKQPAPMRRQLTAAAHEALLTVRDLPSPSKHRLAQWQKRQELLNAERYSSHLYSQTIHSALRLPEVKAIYPLDAPLINGSELLNACFDAILARDPRVIAFGEDVGKLGDVNQGFAGLQAKHGLWRVTDTGIRECTIVGQAIGLALRGLRPIAEIQYLDYLLYALQILSDDLATLHWRTRGGQKAPVIIRTRGHRLEGVWHSGSLMAGAIHLLRGMHVLVPRNMTQAVGFYNQLLLADEPALIVEVLNGYRLKEKMPANISKFTVPLGVPEILRAGDDLTLVTYGACCRIALEAADKLSQVNISLEIIDVQTLLPFDLHGIILDSLKKTSRVLFVDEDVPGGTTAYMLQEVIEKQGGYWWLDSEPRTLPGKPHRPAYGSDGDYWSKPNTEDIFRAVYAIMHEADPTHYPMFY